MYELFNKNNVGVVKHQRTNDGITQYPSDEVAAFFNECGGCSFNLGLYRTHNFNSSLRWAINISDFFPKYKHKIIPFGYDWVGRQFAIDTQKKGVIYMFDPATAEDFELEQSLAQFHNEDLVYDRETTLAEQTFIEVLKILNIKEVDYDACAGYKIPLFLGGMDDIKNYELSEIEVYWEIQRQIYMQIKDLPPGTKINSIKFDT